MIRLLAITALLSKVSGFGGLNGQLVMAALAFTRVVSIPASSQDSLEAAQVLQVSARAYVSKPVYMSVIPITGLINCLCPGRAVVFDISILALEHRTYGCQQH